MIPFRHKLTIIASLFISNSVIAQDPFVDEAKNYVAKATAIQTTWDGPTKGPKIQSNKHIIFIASDMKNGGVLGVIDGMKEAAHHAQWKLDVLDGAGSVNNQLSALNQAIARKPDGIVIGGWNPNIAKIPLKKAVKNGIKLTAWHASPKASALDDYGIFYNVTSDSDEIAKLSAMYAVAHSEGNAKAIIFTDSLYEIALRKAQVMQETLSKCQKCEVLEFIDTPLADTSSRMPNLTFSLIQKYGDKLGYALGINDLYFDFMAPSLRSSNKTIHNISAGDGSITAYQRIRNNSHQLATVPEPLNLHGWQLIDELNRAFANEQPSGYVTPAYLVTHENIHVNGGDKNQYDPQNKYREVYKEIWGIK